MNYSTHNQQMRKMCSTHRKLPNYALRKLSVGVASVLLSTTIFFFLACLGTMAHADTVTPVSGNANNQTDQVNKDPNQQSQSKGAVVHHDQTVTPTLTTSQQVASQEQPNKQANISDSTALNSQQRKETTSTFLNTNYIIASVQNGRTLTESKVSTNGGATLPT